MKLAEKGDPGRCGTAWWGWSQDVEPHRGTDKRMGWLDCPTH